MDESTHKVAPEPSNTLAGGDAAPSVNIVVVLLGVLGGATAAAAAVGYYGTDKFFSVGYAPKQPVEYSHRLHAGELGMDCRYCHSTVERSGFAAVPPTQTCMNCHSKIRTESTKLLPVRESWATDQPIPWVKIHNLPDYVYFDHSAHLAAGVGCSSCHGRVDQMVKVQQVAPLSMSWCLECHRNPTPNLRPKDQVTNMSWTPDQAPAGWQAPKVNPPVNCSGCHR